MLGGSLGLDLIKKMDMMGRARDCEICCIRLLVRLGDGLDFEMLLRQLSQHGLEVQFLRTARHEYRWMVC
jgi:hypothetical protein